jgi:hypothetical protein
MDMSAGMRPIHHGGCLCGHVRYRTMGAPQRTTICHCRFCQRLTGSAFLVEPVFLKADVEVQRGTASTFDYRSPDHGRLITVSFCAKCGTHLSLAFERFPTVLGMCGGTFDDPAWFTPDRHIFIETSVPWMVFPQDVDCYVKHAIAADGTAQKPWQSARYLERKAS